MRLKFCQQRKTKENKTKQNKKKRFYIYLSTNILVRMMEILELHQNPSNFNVKKWFLSTFAFQLSIIIASELSLIVEDIQLYS